MQPYPIQDTDSFESLLGTVKAGFPSPADDFREKLDLVKLLVRHSASTFFSQIDGVSMVDADMDEGNIIIVDRALEPYNGCKALGVKMGDPYFKLKPLIDAINRTLGPGSILFGIQGDGRFHMTQEHKSPRYTIRWTDLPKVSVK